MHIVTDLSMKATTMPLNSRHENAADTSSAARLPPGFEDVERFVENWVLVDSRARAAKRQASTMAEVRGFYDAMLPLARSAIDYLRRYGLDELSPEGGRLLKLMLSLAEVSTAIEWYDSTTVPDSFDFSRFNLIAQTPDEAAQT